MVFEKVIKLNRSSGRALIQPACCHHKGRGAGHRQGQRLGGRLTETALGALSLQGSAQKRLMSEPPQGLRALLTPPPGRPPFPGQPSHTLWSNTRSP